MKKVYAKCFTDSYAFGEGAPSWFEIYDLETKNLLFVLYEGEIYTSEEFRKMSLEDGKTDLEGLYETDEPNKLFEELTEKYNDRSNYEFIDADYLDFMNRLGYQKILNDLGYELILYQKEGKN
jgi:hypothetical protein